MNKSDRRGYIRSYIGVIAIWVCMLITQGHDLLNAMASGKASLIQWIFVVFWIVAMFAFLFGIKKEIARGREKWLKIEQARMNVEKGSLYNPQPQPILISLTELALKKRPKSVGFLIKFTMVCLCIGIILAIILASIASSTYQPFESTLITPLMSFDPTLTTIFLFIPVVICMGATLVMGITIALMILFYSINITATEDYLQMKQGLWKRRVPWQQASLFAIGEDPIGTSQWMELSSATTILRWLNEDAPTRGEYLYFIRATPGKESGYRRVSQEEYQAASIYLNSYIAQKTGLPLRDVRPRS